MYKRTFWKDHVEGVQEGTDMNATNFNNIEVGVLEANALAAMNAEHQRYCTDQAKNNELYAIDATFEDPAINNIVWIPEAAKRNNVNYSVIPVVTDSLGAPCGQIKILNKSLDRFEVICDVEAEIVQITFYIFGGMI